MTAYAANCGNAFSVGITHEKYYIIVGPEFGELEGERILVGFLYNLWNSAARWHKVLTKILRRLGFCPKLIQISRPQIEAPTMNIFVFMLMM